MPPKKKAELRQEARAAENAAVVSAAAQHGSAIDAIAEIINKKYGSGSLVRMDDDTAYQKIDHVIETGLPSLDAAFGVGGFPLGVIVQMYGPESSGKTTLSKHLAARGQQQGVVPVVLDVEKTGVLTFDQALGLDSTAALGGQPDTIEECWDTLLTAAGVLGKKKAAGLGILDSIAAAMTRTQLETGVDEEARMATMATFLTKNLPKLASAIKGTSFGVLLVNQLRDVMNAMPYQKQTRAPGGRALRHWSAVIIETGFRGQIKKGDEVVGIKVNYKMAKNKVAPPYRSADLEIYFSPPRLVDPSAEEPRVKRTPVK